MKRAMKYPKLTLVAALLASGCATLSPESQRQLADARAVYAQAAGDAEVQRYAPLELKSAASALQDAERMAKEGKDPILIEHSAYLADRRARAALGTAQVRETEAAVLQARAERQRAEAQRADVARQQAEARARMLEEERLKVVKEKNATAELAAEVKSLQADLPGVQAKQTERGWIVTLAGELLFESGSTLKDEGQRALDNVAQFLRKHPERRIAVEGFSDGAGAKDAAERLSERRAQAVKFGLVERGIEPYRIDARGFGSAFPVASNDTEGGRQQNRRVEIVINPSAAVEPQARGS
jgi:outer membrane protein OmpA-like peptidoglycan-associated protein